MNTKTGYIYTAEEMERMKAKANEEAYRQPRARFVPMKIPPTKAQLLRSPPRVGRNEPCPCGSGRKFKHCCLGRKE